MRGKLTFLSPQKKQKTSFFSYKACTRRTFPGATTGSSAATTTRPSAAATRSVDYSFRYEEKWGERERRRKGADEGETKELTFSLFALSTFQNPKTPFLSTGLHPGLRRLPLRLPAPLPQPRRSRIHGRGGQGHGSRVRGRRRPQRRGRGL